MRSAASAVRTCAPPAQSGRAGRFFRCGRPLVLQACSSACETALTGAALWGAMPARACCRAATRAPEGVCAGIFVANRSSARAERRERRRGPTAGAAGLRRANVSRDSKRLGARGSAWPCVSEVAAAARAPVPIEIVQLERGARVPRHFLELCEWFRDCSQASGASQRVQRASAPRPTPVGCGADGPAQHGPPRGRSRDRALLNLCAPALLLGFTPLPVRCASVRRRTSLSVLRAARGQRVRPQWRARSPAARLHYRYLTIWALFRF